MVAFTTGSPAAFVRRSGALLGAWGCFAARSSVALAVDMDEHFIVTLAALQVELIEFCSIASYKLSVVGGANTMLVKVADMAIATGHPEDRLCFIVWLRWVRVSHRIKDLLRRIALTHTNIIKDVRNVG
jgi:hypothetical protein